MSIVLTQFSGLVEVIRDVTAPVIVRTEPALTSFDVRPDAVFHIEISDDFGVDLSTFVVTLLVPEQRVLINGDNLYNKAAVGGSSKYCSIDFIPEVGFVPGVNYQLLVSVRDVGNNETTALFDLNFRQDLPISIIGTAIYDYDIGRTGLVEELHFKGSGLIKFRVKTVDTYQELDTALFDGMTFEAFDDGVIDPALWRVLYNHYNIVEANNVLTISGIRTGSVGVWNDTSELQTWDPVGYSFYTSVDVKLHDLASTTGAIAFLAIEDKYTRVEVQKYYKHIAQGVSQAVTPGTAIGKNVVQGEGAMLYLNDIYQPGADLSNLMGGTPGGIDSGTIYPVQTDILTEFKQSVSVLVDDEETIAQPYVRVLQAQGVSDLATTPSGSAMLHYMLDEYNGTELARICLSAPMMDLNRQQVASYNLDSATGEYIVAEPNDYWTTTVFLPLGTYHYKFWVDGEEVPDPNNTDRGSDAVGEYSILELDRAANVTFALNVKAQQVALIGDFNQFDHLANPMYVGMDLSAVSQMFRPDLTTYTNDHADFHKVEIVFTEPITIASIEFRTRVLERDVQRTRIELDDVAIHRQDWTVSTSSARTDFFVNNTDIFTSFVDGVVTWTPNEDIAQQRYSRLALITRIEGISNHTREHELLVVRAGEEVNALVTDYTIVNRRWSEFTNVRSTVADAQGAFILTDIVLHEGANILTPSVTDGTSTAIGPSVTIDVADPQSLVRRANQSDIASGSIDMVLGVSRVLSHSLLHISEVVDAASFNPSHTPAEGESVDPIVYLLNQQGVDILAQIPISIFDQRIFGKLLDVQVPSGGTTVIDIEPNFTLIDNDKVHIDGHTYPLVGARFRHVFLSHFGKIISITDESTHYRIEIDKEFEHPVFVDPPFVGVAFEDLPFCWAIELSDRVGMVTDYIIHADGVVDFVNESGIATGEVQITYNTQGVFVADTDSNVTELSVSIGDTARIMVVPVDNRILLSELHHISFTFFDNSAGSLAPTEVVFKVNGTYIGIDSTPHIENEVAPSGGATNRLISFTAHRALLFGDTVFEGEYDATTNPTLDQIEIEFVARSNVITLSDFQVVGVSLVRNTVFRVVVNGTEVFALEQEINEQKFDQLKIDVERDAFEVFFNNQSYYRGRPDDQMHWMRLPKASIGAKAHQTGDMVTAVFDNFQVVRYLDRNPITLRLPGRFIRTEITLKEDEV